MAWSVLVTWSIALVILTDVFMAVGFSVPFWVSFDQRDVPDTTGQYSVYCGVWYVLVCEAFGTESCSSQAIKTTFRNYTDITFSLSAEDMDNASNQGAILLAHYKYWWALQIVTTISLGLVLISALILMCCRCAGIHSRGLFLIACLLMFVGGLAALTISVLMAVAVGEVFDFGTSGFDLTAETFPWSALLFGVGGLLGTVASFMIAIIVIRWSKYGEYYESEKESLREQPMNDLARSYDRPRYPYNGTKSDYYDRDRYDRTREYPSSQKYETREYEKSNYNRGYEADRSYERGYDQGRNYDREYGRTHQDRGYDIDRGYDQGRNYDRGIDRTYQDRGYDQGTRIYSGTRAADNMYRPYGQPSRY